MADFLGSIQRGLAAAVSTRSEEEEIAGVIKELARQVMLASDGAATVELRKRTAVASQAPLTINRLVAGEKYRSLTLRQLNGSKNIELARWVRSGDGYPCQILYGKTKYSCAEKISLEKVLMIIVSDPLFGESLLDLLNRNDKSEESKIKIAKVSKTVSPVERGNVSSAGKIRRKEME